MNETTIDPEISRSTTAIEAFAYAPLPSPTSIRLVKFISLHRPDGIHCSMITADLEDAPNFDALSYCWANPVSLRERPIADDEMEATFRKLGDGIRSVDWDTLYYLQHHPYLPYWCKTEVQPSHRNITCNGRTMQVTISLHDALVQLKKLQLIRHMVDEGRLDAVLEPLKTSGYLWIDAMCIDQTDPDEKNQQIPLMSRIYQSAAIVRGWIGDMDLLGQLGVEATVNITTRLEQDSTFRGSFTNIYNQFEDLNLGHWLALAGLLLRSWYRRAWVVQEAVFAQRLYLHWGAKVFDWWALVPIARFIKEYSLCDQMGELVFNLVNQQPLARMARRHLKREGPGLDERSKSLEATRQNLAAAVDFIINVCELKEQFRMPSAELELHRVPSTSSGGVVEVSRTTSLAGHSQIEAAREESTPKETDDREPSDMGTGNLEKTECGAAGKLPVDHPPRLSLTLFSLVTKFRTCGATDPRDKVFALLNLAQENDRFQADYRQSVHDVFKMASRQFLPHTGPAILSHVQDQTQTQIHGLPSWVPDFSVPVGKTLLGGTKNCPYSAGRILTQPPLAATITRSGAEVLVTRGIFVDRLSECAPERGCIFINAAELALKTPINYTAETDVLKRPRPQHLILGAIDDPSESTIAQRGYCCTRIDALWRTLIANQTAEAYPARSSTGFGFSAWVAEHIMHAEVSVTVLTQSVRVDDTAASLEKMKALRQTKLDLWKRLDEDESGPFVTYERYAAALEATLKQSGMDIVCSITKDNPDVTPQRYLPDVQLLNKLRKSCESRLQAVDQGLTAAESNRKSAFTSSMKKMKQGRRLFRTKFNLLGLGPRSAQSGDEVWVLPGAKVPFVLRPLNVEGRLYELVGEAYVHGFMDGEAVQAGSEWQSVVIK